MARNFDGVGDELRTSIGACGLTGAFTIVAVLKKASDPAAVFMNVCTVHNSSGTSQFGLEIENNSAGSNLQVQSVAGNVYSTFSVTSADGWVLVAGGKAAGTATPRVHKYVYSSDTWTHQDASGTIGNPGSTAGGTVRWGLWEMNDDFGGDLAASAIFDRNLTDAEVEQLGHSLVDWHALAPVGLWVFDQAATGTAVNDLTGNGAQQSSLTGTTVSTNSVPILGYGHDVQVLSSSAAAGGPANLSRTAADSSSAGDAVTRAFVTSRTAADTSAAGDAATRTLAEQRTAADTSASTDSVSRSPLSLSRSASDTSAAGDSAARALATARTAADTSVSTDSATGFASKGRTAADTSASSDTAARAALSLTRTAGDTDLASDAAARGLAVSRAVPDTSAAADSVTRARTSSRTAADTSAAGDTAARSALAFTRTAADTSASTDVATGSVSSGGNFTRTAADTSASTDAASRSPQTFGRAAADSSASVDVAGRTSTRARTAADTSTSADAAVKQLIRGRTASDTAQSLDSVTRAAQLFGRTAADTALSVDVASGLNLSTIPRYGIDGSGSASGVDQSGARATYVEAGTLVSTIG